MTNQLTILVFFQKILKMKLDFSTLIRALKAANMTAETLKNLNPLKIQITKSIQQFHHDYSGKLPIKNLDTAIREYWNITIDEWKNDIDSQYEAVYASLSEIQNAQSLTGNKRKKSDGKKVDNGDSKLNAPSPKTLKTNESQSLNSHSASLFGARGKPSTSSHQIPPLARGIPQL